MSKYSNEYHHLSKEYLECKKEMLYSLGFLLIFILVPFVFRFLNDDDIFNIPKDDFISVIDFFSIMGVVVSPILLLKSIREWVAIKKEMKSHIN